MSNNSEHNAHRPFSIIETIALILFGALMTVVLLQFVTRYLLNDSLGWTEEIARYLLVCVVFAGSVILVRRGEHIFLEATYRLLPPSNTKPLMIFSAVMSLIYYIILAIFAFSLTLKTGQELISIPVSKAFIYGFIVLSLVFSIGFSAKRLKSLFTMTDEHLRETLDSESIERGGF